MLNFKIRTRTIADKKYPVMRSFPARVESNRVVFSRVRGNKKNIPARRRGNVDAT